MLVVLYMAIFVATWVTMDVSADVLRGFQHFYRCPECRAEFRHMTDLKPCSKCGAETNASLRHLVVGRYVWKPRWYNPWNTEFEVKNV